MTLKKPWYLFSIKFISLLNINSCYHSNDMGCSDIERLANRINLIPWKMVLVILYCNTSGNTVIMKCTSKLGAENKLE